MMEEGKTTYGRVSLSVRRFVEFLCRSGNLDSRGKKIDVTAMNEGTRLHQKIQKSKPDYYKSEQPVGGEVTGCFNGEKYVISLDGRADGIMEFGSIADKMADENKNLLLFDENIFVDEIKCMYADVKSFSEPEKVHLAQAKCYAWFILREKNLDGIGIQMTYCNIEHNDINYFTFAFTREELSSWINGLADEYAKWLYWEKHHREDRNKSIELLEFPFEYRPLQKDLVKNVYLSIYRKKKLYLEAPTGVGKTISTVYPSVKALGRGLAEKIFYSTARTITRTAAEDTCRILGKSGLDMLTLTIVAKEKLCILGKPDCNPTACERAEGHEDRINDAVYDLITHEKEIRRETILAYAEKHRVCPFEFSLDVALWCDMVICDYNYCFDPDVCLKRFFEDSNIERYILLADESHNLVDRAREMYSAELSKGEILKSSSLVNKENKKVRAALSSLNRAFLEVKKKYTEEFTEFEYEDNITLFTKAEKAYEKLLAYVSDRKVNAPDELMDFFFKLRSFVMTAEEADENYVYTGTYYGKDFLVKINCMNPRMRMKKYLSYFRSSIFFSATLLPVSYYKNQLAGDDEDYAIYSPSSFDSSKRKILVATDVSAKYSRRNRDEYMRFSEYIRKMVRARTGNYMVFFPSYKVMNEIVSILADGEAENGKFTFEQCECIVQSSGMDERAREEFLENFKENPEKSFCGFGVMGGVFSEGIDLKSDRLIGVAIVGTGLPMVGNEREMFRKYYDESNSSGFEYAYLYPGMNKVLQAGGRVIRTAEDRGVILLLDDRFLQKNYRNLFPKEWENVTPINMKRVDEELKVFWDT